MDLSTEIQNAIASGRKHKDYAKVCNLADKYSAFITNTPTTKKNKEGKLVETYPLNEYLRQFVRREDIELFEQRKNLTKHHTPAICSQIMKPFNKVVRSNRVVKLIDNNDAKIVEEIEKSMTKFYGESENNGVDQFMNERFKILTFTDPNAWLHISFNAFDAKTEKPQPFPIEHSCKEVIDFQVKNDQTLWLITQSKYKYQAKDDSLKDADLFTIYGPEKAITYKLINDDLKEAFQEDSIWIDANTKKRYSVKNYTHNSGRVPLMRVGYIKDISTNDRTYVNPFHYEALSHLEEFLKVSSELQLSITLHAFPKQVSYVSKCEAKGCNDGMMLNGSECMVCQGSGKKVHTTASDIVELPMPDPKRMNEMVDANKISTYIEFPGNVMEFLDKYADKLKQTIMRMMFNSESIVQTQFNTATEAVFDMDSVYDTLHPFGDKYSEVWMFFTKLSVLYLDYAKDTTVWHKFPSDLKLKTLKQLLEDLKSANDSNAPSYIRESINNDILDIIYADDQSELAKLRIKNRHFPFPGKSDFEINNIILNNNTTKFKQVLYSNFDNIFDDVEADNEMFYDMAFVKQKELIAVKVDEIIQELGANVPVLDLRTA